MEIYDRVKIRLPDTEESEADLLKELIETVSSRLLIRLSLDELPTVLESIVVDATVKMYRRMKYEGITSESGGEISTNFIEDVLSEYADDLQAYSETLKRQKYKLRFL